MARSKRLTIRDIAEAAGVSPGAVSFALNGKPGVSEATRTRILDTATRLGWTPNPTARALSTARTGNVGLVITRPPHTIRDEGFYFPFMCGIAENLSRDGLSLIMRMAVTGEEEQQIYREWASSRHVDGTILVDLATNDPRPGLLTQLGIPFVAVGSAAQGGSALVIDDAEAMRRVVEHISANGYRQPAYVSGIRGFEHTRTREQAFLSACRQAGLATARSYVSDYTEDTGAAITRTIMHETPGVDMIIFDNEMLTFGGMAYLRSHGIRIPGDVGVFSWEDSPLCRVVQPPISALSRNAEELGKQAARLMGDVRALDGEGDPLVRTFPTPHVVARATTAPRA